MSDHEFEDDEEKQESTFEDEYSGLKNIAIILIDIGSGMFDKNRLIKKCLGAVYEQMDKMILRGYRRNISVCFLKDDDIVFTGFNDNIVDSTKKILELLKQSTEDLKDKFERTNAPSLRYTFSECLKQMKNLNKVNPHIVLLTDDDDPHKGDVKENLSAIDVALFFKESNVKLVVLPLKEGFKYELFYGELLKAANDVALDFIDSEDKVYDSVESINDILECIIKNKVTIRRQYFRLYTKEGKELGFWCQIRNLMSFNNLYTNCSLSRETQNPVKLQFEDEQSIDHDKFVVKLPLESDIIVEKNDFKQMSEQMPIGFQLLYLTTNKATSIHYLHRKSIILQKDESVTEGQYPKKAQLFDDMWKYCRDTKKYMICAFLAAGNRQVPHIIEFTADVFQSKPCFVGQIFPDCEEIGDYPSDDDSDEMSFKNKSKIPENDRELGYMCNMIDKLLIKNFSPNLFDCYDYEVKASLIKAQLLDIEVDEVKDPFPTDEEITEKLGDLNEKLKDIFAVVDAPKAKRSRKK